MACLGGLFQEGRKSSEQTDRNFWTTLGRGNPLNTTRIGKKRREQKSTNAG